MDAERAGAKFHWNVAPLVNPDGMLAPKPQRVNGHGVDLNRNSTRPDGSKMRRANWVR